MSIADRAAGICGGALKFGHGDDGRNEKTAGGLNPAALKRK